MTGVRYVMAIRAASSVGVEAVGGRLGGEDDEGRLAVAPVHGLQQVRLLGLRGQAGRRSGALDVDDDERQLGHDAQSDRLHLEGESRAGRRGDTEVAAVRGTERRADPGDLVLGLERDDALRLVLAELVEDVGGGRDGVAAEEQRHPRLARGDHEAVRGGGVAVDLSVLTGGHRGRRHLVPYGERLGRLAVRVAGPERRHVGVADVGSRREPAAEELLGALDGSSVQPGQQAEGEHVLRPCGVLAAEVEVLDGRHSEAGEVESDELVGVERAVGERVGGIADAGQVPFREVGGVDDDHAAEPDVGQVHLEGCRVHGDEHFGVVAGRGDVAVGEVELEAGDAGQGAGWRPDLGGEVGQRGDVVAERGGVSREAVAGQLHAVAGVAGETDHDMVQCPYLGHRAPLSQECTPTHQSSRAIRLTAPRAMGFSRWWRSPDAAEGRPARRARTRVCGRLGRCARTGRS